MPIITSTPYRTTYQQVVLADNPVGYWRKGDAGSTLADSSGNGFDGTYNNSPALVSGLINDPDGARSYVSASSQTATVPDDPALRPGANADMTIECWINLPDVDQLAGIVGKREVGPNREGWALTVSDNLAGDTAGKEIHFYYFEKFSGLGFSRVNVNSTAAIADGNTHHIVVTVDADAVVQKATLYVDGNIPGQSSGQAGPYPTIDNTDPITFGFTPNHGTFLDGTVDEVAYYNYVLPQSRIQAHYNKGI